MRSMVSAAILTLSLTAHAGEKPLSLQNGGGWNESGRTLQWGKADPWLTVGSSAFLVAGLAVPEDPFTYIEPGTADAGGRIDDWGPFSLRVRPSEPWKIWGDIWMFGSGFGLASVLVPYEFKKGAARRNLARAAIVWDTWAITLGATNALKVAAQRPRPYTVVSPESLESEFGNAGDIYAYPGDEDYPEGATGTVIIEGDSMHSWPSGHSSMVASAFWSVTTVGVLSMKNRELKHLAWFAVPLFITGTTAYSRTRAIAHYPTDALSGWALGTAVGVLVPLAHYRKNPGEMSVQLTPMQNGMALSGRW